MIEDGFSIKLVDQRVRAGKPALTNTICVFRWIEGHLATDDSVRFDGQGEPLPRRKPEWIESFWSVEPKPIGRRQELRQVLQLRADGVATYQYGPTPRRQGRFEIPGLSLRWEKVTPVLDRLARAGVTTCTVAELRRFVQRS